MSYSLEFCKARASNPDTSSYADRDWEQAVEIPVTEQVFDKILQGHREYRITGRDERGDEIDFYVKIVFDPDGDFDYFISDSHINDGTLLFAYESVDKIVNRVLSLTTYDGSQDAPLNGHTINWTIGNFVWLCEYDGDWEKPKEKPWLLQRDTILLPLKYEQK